MSPMHRTILKEYDNKFSIGYYSNSVQRKEKNDLIKYRGNFNDRRKIISSNFLY